MCYNSASCLPLIPVWAGSARKAGNVRAVRVALICFFGYAVLAKAQTNFFIQDIHVNPDSSVTITWPAVPLIPYHVMFADSPTGMWQNFPDGTVTAGSNVSALGYTDTNSFAVTQRFYKVRTTRLPVIMTLVVDRSGSMDPSAILGTCTNNSRGGLYLPDAVTAFINIFDETLDQAAVVTFASSSSNDVPMTHLFKTGTPNVIGTITRINSGHLWAGGTCSMAGLTNALVIQNSVNDSNAVKVVVFFTDGRANMIQGVFNGVPLNFGGQDPIQVGCLGTNPGADFSVTNAAETVAAQNNAVGSVNCGGTLNFIVNGTKIQNIGHYTDLTGAHSFCADSITLDATNRCARLAEQMRGSSNYVYAVGLAAPGATAPPTIQWLQIMANDPSSPQFDPTQPVGAAFLSDGSDLTEVFQQVAADIMLRMGP